MGWAVLGIVRGPPGVATGRVCDRSSRTRLGNLKFDLDFDLPSDAPATRCTTVTQGVPQVAFQRIASRT